MVQMETFETTGFASIKVLIKDNLIVKEVSLLHKYPNDIRPPDKFISHIETELREGVKQIIAENVVKDGLLRLFIQYKDEAYK